MTSIVEICRAWLLPIGVGAGIGMALGEVDGQLDLKESSTDKRLASRTSQGPVVRAGDSERMPPRQGVQKGDTGQSESLESVLADIVSLEARLDDVIRKLERRDCEGADCPSFFAPDQAMLDEWARCGQLPVDVPPALLGRSEHWLSHQALSEVDATDDERSELDEAFAEFFSSFRERIVAIHDRILGDEAPRDRPTHALVTDLRGMQDVLDEDATDRRIVALERAGQIELGSRTGGPMIEFYRELVGLGDEIEAVAASVLGKERARTLRASGGSWGARITNIAKCRDGDSGSTTTSSSRPTRESAR